MMNNDFFYNQEKAKNFLRRFELFLQDVLNRLPPLPFRGHRKLKEALYYSLFTGGKRFRPLLIFATAQMLKIKTSVILPWAGAIEMIHTASLIHDDLPCMDNSLQRRKKASCHRRFGESTALLAGDCLWIEAFRLISRAKESRIWLTALCAGAGFYGLMGGQALDLNSPPDPDEEFYTKMHSMKTGALIVACMEGVLTLKPGADSKKLKKTARLIGRAFQLSDDLQEEKEKKELSNLAHILGEKKARSLLKDLSLEALLQLKDFPSPFLLKKLIVFNQNRALNSKV